MTCCGKASEVPISPVLHLQNTRDCLSLLAVSRLFAMSPYGVPRYLPTLPRLNLTAAGLVAAAAAPLPPQLLRLTTASCCWSGTRGKGQGIWEICPGRETHGKPIHPWVVDMGHRRGHPVVMGASVKRGPPTSQIRLFCARGRGAPGGKRPSAHQCFDQSMSVAAGLASPPKQASNRRRSSDVPMILLSGLAYPFSATIFDCRVQSRHGRRRMRKTNVVDSIHSSVCCINARSELLATSILMRSTRSGRGRGVSLLRAACR